MSAKAKSVTQTQYSQNDPGAAIVSQTGGVITTANGATYASRQAYNDAFSVPGNSSFNGTINQIAQNAALEQSLQSSIDGDADEAAADTAAGANYAASVSTLAGADLAANETSGAISTTQTAIANPPATASSGSSLTKWVLIGGAVVVGALLWKKHKKKKAQAT